MHLASRGGGTLVVPRGVFLSGAIFLKPGVNLHLDEGAVLSLGEQEGMQPDFSAVGDRVLLNFGSSNHIIDILQQLFILSFNIVRNVVNTTYCFNRFCYVI